MSRDFNKYFFEQIRLTGKEPTYEEYASREAPEEEIKIVYEESYIINISDRD